MQRLALKLALSAALLCCGAGAARAQGGAIVYPGELVQCRPLPYWYPRGWELMVRTPCYAYYPYGQSYYSPGHQPYRVAYPVRRGHAAHRVHGRPYLRPGWWW